MTKVYTNILFLIKFAIKRFVIEIKPKMLSVSDGPKDGRTDLQTGTVKYRTASLFK